MLEQQRGQRRLLQVVRSEEAVKRLLITGLTATMLLTGVPAHAQSEHQAMCVVESPNSFCANQYVSTPGPHGMLRANVDDGQQAFGSPAFHRAVVIFRLWYDPTTGKSVPVVIGTPANCYALTNCYAEARNDDPDPTFTFDLWWVALIDSHGHVLQTAVGYFSS